MYEYRKLPPDVQAEVLAYRQSRGHPLHAPPHPATQQGWFLITAATFEHRRLFHDPTHRDWLLAELQRELAAVEVTCSAWVVLPNHYHLLIETAALERLSVPLRRAHARTARELNRRDACEGRRVWYRYTDRHIRNAAHFHTTLNYIHYNPVKHGYAASPLQWNATSVHWYLHHWGEPALDALWAEYPLRAYGSGWDE